MIKLFSAMTNLRMERNTEVYSCVKCSVIVPFEISRFIVMFISKITSLKGAHVS